LPLLQKNGADSIERAEIKSSGVTLSLILGPVTFSLYFSVHSVRPLFFAGTRRASWERFLEFHHVRRIDYVTLLMYFYEYSLVNRRDETRKIDG